jgi:3-methyladenine DNA glycosylase AlkD
MTSLSALTLARILIEDPHDLIHKAVGWVLREVGKKDQIALEEFLLKHYLAMPRTMLRYAIERLPNDKKKHYLRK